MEFDSIISAGEAYEKINNSTAFMISGVRLKAVWAKNPNKQLPTAVRSEADSSSSPIIDNGESNSNASPGSDSSVLASTTPPLGDTADDDLATSK